MSEVVVLLHGFGGSPEGLEPLKKAARKHWSAKDIVTPDLHKDTTQNARASIKNWADEFASDIEKRSPTSLIVIGYSMGGRLGLSLLWTSVADRIRNVICLSSRPGFWIEAEARKRIQFDETWSQRFKELDYDTLNTEWQKLVVFSGSKPASLRRDVLPADMAFCFENWSPAKHPFSIGELQKYSAKLFWLYGEGDQVYQTVRELVASKSLGQISTVTGAGHRLLVDNQAELMSKLNQIFLTGEL